MKKKSAAIKCKEKNQIIISFRIGTNLANVFRGGAFFSVRIWPIGHSNKPNLFSRIFVFCSWNSLIYYFIVQTIHRIKISVQHKHPWTPASAPSTTSFPLHHRLKLIDSCLITSKSQIIRIVRCTTRCLHYFRLNDLCAPLEIKNNQRQF